MLRITVGRDAGELVAGGLGAGRCCAAAGRVGLQAVDAGELL